ncbi:serine/arginine repetitive matrix protein 1-like [Bolinopsis microptera]|uniref:serine/arginine repetitive matrix protein 1-like n=1 Tax=Bolinopsis microptera TaxID=2820187 RepID=UPI0030790B7E
MGEVKRSDSKGDISKILDDIRGIVHGNKETLDGLKAIKQKNEETSKVKTRVDIPSVVSGFKSEDIEEDDERDLGYLYFPYRKWCEIDIPHKKAKGGERESQINKRSKRLTLPEPTERDQLEHLPMIEADTVRPVESAPRTGAAGAAPRAGAVSREPEQPSPPQRLPRRDQSEERRRGRRDKSVERKRRMDAIRQKTYDRKKEQKPEEAERRGRDTRHPDKEEEEKPEPPSRRVRPKNEERPSRRRTRPSAPDELDGRLPTVEVGSGPTEHTAAPEPPPPDPPVRLPARGRTPSGHSSPEIEIRICKRSGKCGNNLVPQELLKLQSQPDPPARAPQQKSNNYESPLSPSYRSKSPSEREMERLAARLEALKKEVNSVIRDCEEDTVGISLREAEDRPKSPYYPDKSPYYRARYHSSPQSPTGQNDKTTSTTELPQVYHPAKQEHFYNAERDLSPLPSERDLSPLPSERDLSPLPSERDLSPLPSERDSSPQPEMLYLSTQTLELPGDEGVPITDQLELEVLSLTEVPELHSHFVPVQNQAPSSYEEVYEPECDPNLTTNHVITDTNNRPKREEQLLTPPPLPDRDPHPDITLRGDNLYDPYHIGTTFVVLSRQNHGRFKFSSPLDPNSSAPGSPIRGSPLPGSTSGSSPKSVPRNEAPDVPVITPAVAASSCSCSCFSSCFSSCSCSCQVQETSLPT